MAWHRQTSTDQPTAAHLPRELPPLASSGLAKLLVGLAAAAGLAGCASAEPYNPARLPLAQLGQVREICRSVMGISEGTGLMTDCVGQLSRSAAALGHGRSGAHALQAARSGCLARGLTPGQPALAECELNAAPNAAAPGAELASMTIDAAAPPQGVRSYDTASFNEVRRREKAACARLGYDPIDPAGFGSCVASLDAALYASEHAPQ
jgi:hypothetical protein